MTEQIRLVEDEEFPYGGYARGGVEDLVIGDGVRFAEGGPCWLVVAIDGSIVTLANRSQHVASVLSDAFGRVLDGASADSELHVRDLSGQPVWIRL